MCKEPVSVTGGKRLCQLWSYTYNSLATNGEQTDSVQCVRLLLQTTQGSYIVQSLVYYSHALYTVRIRDVMEPAKIPVDADFMSKIRWMRMRICRVIKIISY